jgi:hypothetical protein
MLSASLSDLSRTFLALAFLGVLGAGTLFYVSNLQNSYGALKRLTISSGHCGYHISDLVSPIGKIPRSLPRQGHRLLSGLPCVERGPSSRILEGAREIR